MKKIAVLMGGTSNERAVSLASGKNVAHALTSLGRYDVRPVVLDSDDLSGLPDGMDAVYIALHGGWGENGGVQAALDARAIPYTGPGAKASRIAMDKIETKRVLAAAGVPTADWTVVHGDGPGSSAPVPSFPCVVKAPRDGSSVGVYLVHDAAEHARAIAAARRIDAEKFGAPGEALVEAFIPGREMTVGVIDGVALPVIEIVARKGWYGYDEKYRSDETRYPFLADSANPADKALEAELQRLAVAAYRAVGCRGVTRVDFRVTPDGACCYVLELNTSPGFTSHSLVPMAGMKTGLTFAEVCARILESAACDRTC
ncbi:MAG: D-alanine--D-alanine ligase [Kiritimatiellia bacterium]